jgi:hypothetical protein
VSTRRLNGFSLGERIAKTAHSRVWLAVDEDGETVVVKELHLRSADREPYRRFQREVKFHREHTLDGVLPVLGASAPDSPSDDEPPWIAMPLAQTVRMVLGDDASLEHVVEAIASYAETLATLAERGVHHRDLKPDNLFVLDGRWVVGDFGLVTIPGAEELTEPGSKLGPANFIAPEMVTDAAAAADGPADVWSIAKTLWALAAHARYPPQGQLRTAVTQTRLRDHTVHSDAAQLEPILERATDFNPAARPTMREIAVELRAWLAPPVPARPVPDTAELARQIRAITAPTDEEEMQRLARDHEMHELFRVLEETLAGDIYNAMRDAGEVDPRNDSLLLLVFGGTRGRRDAVSTGSQALVLRTSSPHAVYLTVAIAYELFEDGGVRLVAGAYTQAGAENPELVWIEMRDVIHGTAGAERAAAELAEALRSRHAEALARFSDDLRAAERERQPNRQQHLTAVGETYRFETDPTQAGFILIFRNDERSRAREAVAVAWPGSPLLEIRAEGDRLFVRSAQNSGWITRKHNGTWALHAAA